MLATPCFEHLVLDAQRFVTMISYGRYLLVENWEGKYKVISFICHTKVSIDVQGLSKCLVRIHQ